jgi:uncharacterized protein with PhoU and TrkA domain
MAIKDGTRILIDLIYSSILFDIISALATTLVVVLEGGVVVL